LAKRIALKQMTGSGNSIIVTPKPRDWSQGSNLLLYREASLELRTKQVLAAQSKRATVARAYCQTVCRKCILLAGPLRRLAPSYFTLLDNQRTLTQQLSLSIT